MRVNMVCAVCAMYSRCGRRLPTLWQFPGGGSLGWMRRGCRGQRRRNLASGGAAAGVQNVVVVHKTSRLDFERMRQPHLSEREIMDELVLGGVDLSYLRERHRAHTESLTEIQSYLISCGCTVQMRNRESFSTHDVNWADMIVAAGGDGNFLYTASKVLSPEKLVVGVNTDPVKSEGFLCLRPSSLSLSDHLCRVLNGEYREVRRQRIRVRMGSTTLPVPALNEVFVGEKDISHSSYYEVSHDDSPVERQKSSGLLLYTGSGSTSWAYNMNKVSPEAVKRLFEVAEGAGGSVSLPPGCSREQMAKEVSEIYNAGNIFGGEEQIMGFTVREPIIRGIFASGSIHGYARRVTVTSRSWNATLVVDGHCYTDFPNGSTIHCELYSSDSLRTVVNQYTCTHASPSHPE